MKTSGKSTGLSHVDMPLAVQRFFCAFIDEDVELSLEKYCEHATPLIYKDGARLIFTLHGLFERLIDNENVSYAQFRASLYSSQLNQHLATLGYKVSIYESTKKVDSSWYQLAMID